MNEENILCPQCGKMVSKTDKYCKNCGATLTEPPVSLPAAPQPPQPVTEAPPYERKFSIVQRFYKLVTAPSEAMKDVALAPDYEGVYGIVAFEFVLLVIGLVIVTQKIQFAGPYADRITSELTGVLSVAAIIAVVLLIIMWLGKSFIVRYACDSGSSWSFSTAASVTGYAYIADVVFAIIGLSISWLILPAFRVDTTDLNTAIQQMNDYRGQLNLLRLTFTLPFNLLGITWKSYLGGLGTHFGTNEKCSKLNGFIIFFVLSLIGLLISFATYT